MIALLVLNKCVRFDLRKFYEKGISKELDGAELTGQGQRSNEVSPATRETTECLHCSGKGFFLPCCFSFSEDLIYLTCVVGSYFSCNS